MPAEQVQTVKQSDVGLLVYRLSFFGFIFSTPVFLQYVMRAPMPADYSTFHPVPALALTARNVAEVDITGFPGNEIGSLACAECGAAGYLTWKSFVQIRKEHRYDKTKASYGLALYTTLLMSTDFKDWVVVADSKAVAEGAYLGQPTEVGDIAEIGCKATTDQEKERVGDDVEFSLSEHLGSHGTVQIVACIVQGYSNVMNLKKYFGNSSRAPFEKNCIAVGSTCGTPCGIHAGHSDTCDTSTMTILPEYLFSGNTIKNLVSEDFSLRHSVTIGNRKLATKNAMNDCEPCEVACADKHWRDHCKKKGENDKHNNCDDWKCKDPSDGDDPDPEPVPGPSPGPDPSPTPDPVSSTVAPDTTAAPLEGFMGEGNATVQIEQRRLATNSCRERYECKNTAPKGLKIKDLYVEAELNSADAPDALSGGFYTVIFSGTNLTQSSDPSTPPAGNWSLIYVPLEHELLHQESNVSSRVMIDPTLCIAQPGFLYLAACMTAERVNGPEKGGMVIKGPPFNDRCVAVGGACGGACGSDKAVFANAKQYCPGYSDDPDLFATKFMSSRDGSSNVSMSSSMRTSGTSRIRHADLIGDITPNRSSEHGGIMFHLFVICMTISFLVTAQTYFPGNFRAYFPSHSWEEIQAHSYIMNEFSCLVAFGVSKGEDKFFVLRNWLGKLSAVPQFTQTDGAVFTRDGTNSTKWVDVFADEGHREGAREMYQAYSAFLALDPPVAFIEAWAKQLRYVVWDKAMKASAFDLCWMDGNNALPVLPVTPEQSLKIYPSEGPPPSVGKVPAKAKGVHLSEECLKSLAHFRAVYDALPRSMKLRENVGIADDCILTYPVNYGGQEIYMIYAARGNPEHDSRRELKTRRLDQYHWACLSSGTLCPDASTQQGEGQGGIAVEMQEGSSPPHQQSSSSVDAGSHGTSVRTSNREALSEEIVKAVNSELSHPSNQLEGISYGEAQKRRIDDQSMWEKCRCCYGKIVGQQIDASSGAVLLLDDVSNAFQELMQSSTFREYTGCGYPRQQVVKEKTTFRRKNKKVTHYSTADEQTRNHRIISVPRKYLEPYFGVRGKAGAQNFVVDLLRQRGWIYPAELARQDVKRWKAQRDRTMETFQDEGAMRTAALPRRFILFGIFDVRHQPHNDFWMRCMPAFFFHSQKTYDYEVNNQVCLVQAPQSFASVRIVDDYLDVNNGLLFNMMNIIRNCVGGVTSCGTNGVWLLDTTETWKEYGGEFFDSRTKIEDTASSHRQFMLGRRSVYVHEVVATGIAKMNAAYLGATQRWAEGAVQIFWTHFFIDFERKLWAVLFFILLLYAFFFWSMYTQWWPFFWCCPIRSGSWCFRHIYPHPYDDGIINPVAYLTWPSQQLCEAALARWERTSNVEWSEAIWLVSTNDLVRLIDFSCHWFIIVMAFGLCLVFCNYTGRLPGVVRTVIMFENCTYFWSSPTVFFWVGLSAYMVLTNSTPFQFEVLEWMGFAIVMVGTKYVMQQKMKNAGGCDEMSIWRSQQMFFVGAPLHIMSLIQGTQAAYGIKKTGIDKSFWSATDHGVEVVNFVKMWTSFLLLAALTCVISISIGLIFFPPVGSAQIMACLLLITMAMTIWTPVLDIWGLTGQISSVRHVKTKTCCSCLFWKKQCAILMFWGRSRSYWMRWLVDLGIPIAFILSSGGAHPLMWISAYSREFSSS